MLSRDQKHAELIREEVEQSRVWGIDVELISPLDAHRLMPFLEPDGIELACYTPGDIYIEEPSSLLHAYAAAGERLGVRILGHTPVTGIDLSSGEVRGGMTAEGEIATPVVVDAAGAWARLVGQMAQADVPIEPVRHQLFITEPIGGIASEQPILRIIDSAVYIRPARGGLMLGGFESDPLPFDLATADPRFSMDDVPLDRRVLDRLASTVEGQVPALRGADWREHRGGLFTMSPDGRFLVGPVPGVQGLWSATGCNGSGFSSSPAIGLLLAEWITEGEPSIDLSILQPQRFASLHLTIEQLRAAGIWQYAHYYDHAASQSGAVYADGAGI
jgi:glycine/D-amino acid oxidase-like deaminating enzyme